MIDTPYEGRVTPIPDSTQTDRSLCAQICAEYLDMPGMRLSVPQAARLFNLEPTRCARLLKALAADGTLWTNGREFFCGNVRGRSGVSRTLATN